MFSTLQHVVEMWTGNCVCGRTVGQIVSPVDVDPIDSAFKGLAAVVAVIEAVVVIAGAGRS